MVDPSVYSKDLYTSIIFTGYVVIFYWVRCNLLQTVYYTKIKRIGLVMKGLSSIYDLSKQRIPVRTKYDNFDSSESSLRICISNRFFP